ncbi:hypothetical protein SynWH8101_0550 [Synechococcus sp. WH 8101]|nr:hypothetical protein SynWH8101_0550 [Synechococcus sp. WH 8101]
MLNWFVIGGIIVGFTAPQHSLDKDREDRIQLNKDGSRLP